MGARKAKYGGIHVVLRAPRFLDLDLCVTRQCVRRHGCGTSVQTAEAMMRPMRRVGRILAAFEGGPPLPFARVQPTSHLRWTPLM